MNIDLVDIKDRRRFDSDTTIFEIDKDDITIVIPVLNEQEAIGQVIQQLKNEGYYRILVIDGYSTDDTVSIASKNGVRIFYQHGVGKTGAIKTAIEHVETPYLLVMDGDYTYDPKDIKNFIPHLKENYEVIGMRIFGRENIPILNRFGNWVINRTFNFLFGAKLLDVCSGMYALQTDFARTLSLETGGFDVEVEIAAQAAREGDITQVPINYRERLGTQKLRPFRHGLQIQLSMMKLVMKHNPIFVFSLFASLCLFPAMFILPWVIFDIMRGNWRPEWALLGSILLIIGLFALTVSAFSMLIKRTEQIAG